LHFRFPDAPRCASLCLKLQGVWKRYGGTPALEEVDLEISRGEKWALVGPNGAGKSTLMRIMAGIEPPDDGSLRRGAGVQAGYFSPERLEELAFDGSVLELVESWAPTELVPSVRGLLGAFLFRDDEVHKSVSVLSGGERSRLALLRLLLSPSNLLFLDEPTNHLDLLSKDVLLDALSRYTGTVVFVSHDRQFIASLADRVLELHRGRARSFPGDFDYYLWRTQQEAEGRGGADVRPAAGGGAGGGGTAASGPGRSAAGSSDGARPSAASGGRGGPGGAQGGPTSDSERFRRAAKAQQAELRRLKREEEGLLDRLEELASEKSRLEHELAREEVYRDGDRVRELKARLEANSAEQERLSRRWEDVDSSQRALVD
jgi:ATP-binding cassette subfamily F protein 3